MSVQNRIGDFTGPDPTPREPPTIPEEGDLEELIAPNWMYDFDVEQVYKINELRQAIADTVTADDPIKKWSHILGDRFSCGNTKKVAKEVCIWNPFGSGIDCVNRGEEQCQVGENECYAVVTEKGRPDDAVLSSRRKEQIVWDYIDAVTFARAFRRWYNRKRNEVTDLRVSESGDFRSEHDLYKLDEIARRLGDIVTTYTYSASYWLPWDDVDHFIVNQSSPHGDFGARRFKVVDDAEDIPADGIRCPNDISGTKCGDCRLCLNESAPDVFVENFHS